MATTQTAAAGGRPFRLRVRWDGGQARLDEKEIGAQTPLHELLAHLATITGIPAQEQALRSGYPPTLLNLSNPSQPLEALGLRPGDTLTVASTTPAPVQTDSHPPAPDSTPAPSRSTVPADAVGGDPNGECILRRVVPADNSCLFRSIAYLVSPEAAGQPAAQVSNAIVQPLRQTVASRIRAEPERWTEATLGRSPDDYCKWITSLDAWGGGIEIALLAEALNVQIGAVDIQTGRVDMYAQDRPNDSAILLLYDGIHYDPLVLSPIGATAPEDFCLRRIDIADVDRVARLAQQLSAALRERHQFTDVGSFTLRCLVCRTKLRGQSEAQAHAKQTGHTNFGEVD
ncbi:uncharacterized protein MONBRDRAFT_33794 [Monosiga brevicollis MX1]|uniref:Ubiquitin thioesterase OTU n=1 Tax=Monosiga brevicollis TaxID=81824 RepID=A9V7J5_MONBE|nr:uncharacterized protein MONBRDRAFT_33794 [Monosiga brevicollis MX1]EDQ86595.1 predicted protein [Monosiga brevicollis MX1]|eukprot:XP_001748708.1 hypothetical protein [Monosiga brevicollis MX1]